MNRFEGTVDMASQPPEVDSGVFLTIDEQLIDESTRAVRSRLR